MVSTSGVSEPAQQAPAISGRLKFFTHAGQEILLVDFSHANTATVKATAEECRRIVAARPLASVRTFVDVTRAHFDKETIQAATQLASHNHPYVVRSAVIGITGLLQIAFNAIVAASKRNMRVFDTKEDALNWLAKND